MPDLEKLARHYLLFYGILALFGQLPRSSEESSGTPPLQGK